MPCESCSESERLSEAAPAQVLDPVVDNLSRLILCLATISNVSGCEDMPFELTVGNPEPEPNIKTTAKVLILRPSIRVFHPSEAFAYLASLLCGRVFVEGATAHNDETATLVSQMG